MTTVDYGATPISKLKRAQLELAYESAIWTRDRALAQVAEQQLLLQAARVFAVQQSAKAEGLAVTNQEQADELAALVARLKRVRATLPTSSPVVLVAQVLAALDGPDTSAALAVAQS